jgi:serine protease AprX
MKRTRKVIFATLTTLALMTSLAFTGPSMSTASNGELTFVEVKQSSLEREKDSLGKAKFLIEDSLVTIPKGIETKLNKIPADNTLYVVQFTGPITEDEKKSLVLTGVEIGDYIPDYAFIVDAKGVNLSEIKNVQNVESVKALKPLYKFDPQFFQLGASELVKATIQTVKGKKEKVQIKGIEAIIQYGYRNDVVFVSKDYDYKKY